MRTTLELIIRLLTTTATKWWDDNPWRLSAALSYYTLFSLAPLLTLAVAVATVVVDERVVQGEMLRQFKDLIGENGANAMTPMLHSAGHRVHGTVATLISFITLFIVSMGMFSELQDLAEFHLADSVPGTEFCSFGTAQNPTLLIFAGHRDRFPLVAALVLNVVMAAAGHSLERNVQPQVLMMVIDIMGSPLVMAVLFTLMFKMLPAGHIAWQDVWIGGTLPRCLRWDSGRSKSSCEGPQ